MAITLRENLEHCKDRIVYTFDKEKITEVVDEIASVVAKQHTIKGFRKGKAPIEAVKSNAKKFILAHAEQRLANDAFADIVHETDLKPFGPPVVSKAKTTYDSFMIDMNISYLPSFDLQQYKDFELKEPDDVPTITAMEENIIENIQKQFPTLRVFGENDFLLDGDSVLIDYVGTVDGEIIDGGKAEGVPIEIGGNQVIRNFEVNMFGMSVGEEREFDVEYDESMDRKLAGKTVHFKVKLVSGTKKDLAPLDEDLAKKAGFPDLEKMKEQIKQQALLSVENIRKNQLKIQVVDKLLESNTINVPDWMVLESAKGIAKNHGLDFEKTEPETRKQLLKDSLKVIKLNLILDKIRSTEVETELSDAELDNILKNNIPNLPQNVQQALTNPKLAPSVKAKLYSEIQDEQTYFWIIDHSTVVKEEKDATEKE